MADQGGPEDPTARLRPPPPTPSQVAVTEPPGPTPSQVAVTEPPDLAPPRTSLPTKIGRFEVASKLGEGGMGVVLLATDPTLGRRVALKVLRDAGPDDDAKRRLVREAQAVAQLVHENVIVVHEVDTFEGQVFVAMEYVAGKTLGRWQVGRPWREVLATYLRAGRGLQAAHAAGLVHRDFKPDNVLIGDDGRVRVTDFGLVATVDAPPETAMAMPRAGSELAALLTRTGTIMGTPRFMAPEQHLATSIDARADQFAFCAALYEALYGVQPFAGKSVEAIANAVIAGELRPIPDDTDVPPAIGDAIVRGLSRERDARFPSIDELLVALAGTPPTPAVSRKRRWPVAVAGGGTVAALGIGAFVLLREPPTIVREQPRNVSCPPTVAIESIKNPTEADKKLARDYMKTAETFLQGSGVAEAVPLYEKALRLWDTDEIRFALGIFYNLLDCDENAIHHLDIVERRTTDPKSLEQIRGQLLGMRLRITLRALGRQ